MKKNHAPTLLATILLVGLVFLTFSSTCMAQVSAADEREYRDQVNLLIAAHHYEQAASVLEKLLAKAPYSNDELVYKQLTHIYEDYLFDYDKALTIYVAYLAEFPAGRFTDDFQIRVTYLEERRAEWQALRAFKRVQLEEEAISVDSRLTEVEAILSKNRNARIAPEMHWYLANAYYDAAEYSAAREHAREYIDKLDTSNLTTADKPSALRLYADILVKQHHDGKAIRALNQAIALASPEDRFNYAVRKNEIIEQRNMRYGFMLCLFYDLSVILWLYPSRCWRASRLLRNLGRLAKPILLLALVSLGPVWILNMLGVLQWNPDFFYWLLGLSVPSLIVLSLLAPLSRRIGRLVYVSMSGLHMAAAAYIAYYLTVYGGGWTDMSGLTAVDIDPLSSEFKIGMWTSVIASTFLFVIHSWIIFDKELQDRSSPTV